MARRDRPGGCGMAWVVAIEQRGPTTTYGDFRAPGDELTERVDWILVGGGIDVRWVETVLHNDDGQYPSDHYPVAAPARATVMLSGHAVPSSDRRATRTGVAPLTDRWFRHDPNQRQARRRDSLSSSAGARR